MSTVRIEGEVSPATLSRPRQIDHGWLFATAGLHLRLPTVVAESSDPGVSIEFLDDGIAVVTIEGDPRWSNGRPISMYNYEVLLSRSANIQQVSVYESGRKALVRFNSSHSEFLQIINSPGMVLTPETHNYGKYVTSGPYVVDAVRGQFRTISYKKRLTTLSGPDSVIVVHPADAAEGLDMFLADDLDVTRTLGAEVKTLRTYHSQVVAEPVDLIMGISGGTLQEGQSCMRIDVDALSLAAAGSYKPRVKSVDWTFSVPAVEFVNFHPNREVVRALSRMAHIQLGTVLAMVEISYESYLCRPFCPTIPLLEICVGQNTRTHSSRSFLPLLQAMTTCLVSERIKRYGFLQQDATIDWTCLEVT